jgi:hypothetical protein
MGYLNNTTRVLDAILTKKGREILSSGGSGGLGSFEVTKFALGDDEIDYGLWDTTHTLGSTYYGAVLDNLPALEPFNDPSEIMKYKLVTRSEDTEAMAQLQDKKGTESNFWQPRLADGGATGDTGLNWWSTQAGGGAANRVRVVRHQDAGASGTAAAVGRGKVFGVQHLDNEQYGAVDYDDYKNEGFTITVLDSTVAFLAPQELEIGDDEDNQYPFYIKSSDKANQDLWLPYVTSVQHVSQTIRNCKLHEGEFIKLQYNPDAPSAYRWVNGNWRPGTGLASKGLAIYPKRIASNNSPAKTTILITGETSGATFEYDVTVTYGEGTGV